MKSFKDTTNEVSDDSLQESRLIRKGAAILLARSAKKHGDTATNHFAAAQRLFSRKLDQSLEDQMENLLKGLNEVCDGLISLRKQNGSNTSIATAAVLFNERTDKQITSLMKRRKWLPIDPMENNKTRSVMVGFFFGSNTQTPRYVFGRFARLSHQFPVT